MNVIEMAASLIEQVRTEGATSRAVTVGRQLTVAVCDAAEPPDIDAERRWASPPSACAKFSICSIRRIELPTDLTSKTNVAAASSRC